MNRRALVIDDSVTLRQMVAMTLREAGFDVLEAGSGDEGVSCLDGRPLALIVTDLNMPRMDGITFVRSARETPAYRTTPIIILTTDTDEHQKRDARAAGASCWMVKPFSPDQFVQVLGRLVPMPVAR